MQMYKGKLQLKLAQPLNVAEGRSHVMLPISSFSEVDLGKSKLELVLAKLANQWESSRCLIFGADICIWWGHAWGEARMIQPTGVDEKESNQAWLSLSTTTPVTKPYRSCFGALYLAQSIRSAIALALTKLPDMNPCRAWFEESYSACACYTRKVCKRILRWTPFFAEPILLLAPEAKGPKNRRLCFPTFLRKTSQDMMKQEMRAIYRSYVSGAWSRPRSPNYLHGWAKIFSILARSAPGNMIYKRSTEVQIHCSRCLLEKSPSGVHRCWLLALANMSKKIKI